MYLTGAPFLGGPTMSLIETVESDIGEWTRSVDIEEEFECKINGVVLDSFVFVLVDEFEVEDNGVIVRVIVIVIGSDCFVERRDVE
jgi:hypothetical protein